MSEKYEVKVTVGNATVEVSGAKDGVVEIVKALSEVLRQQSNETTPPADTPRDDDSLRPPLTDPRSFFAEKSPKSQNEAVVVAAYYLAELAPENERSDTIDHDKAQNVMRQAKFKLPKNLKAVLVNTQAAGYLDRVGTGEYRLNPVGLNLVEHSLNAD